MKTTMERPAQFEARESQDASVAVRQSVRDTVHQTSHVSKHREILLRWLLGEGSLASVFRKERTQRTNLPKRY
jgi:hypothetical protein